jgi:phage shock protein A
VSAVLATALANARAGKYDAALAALGEGTATAVQKPITGMRAQIEKAREAAISAVAANGPAKLQARATELTSLELWGRGYDVLAPFKDQIKGAPKFAIGFAELAFRAGETAVAREVLQAIGATDIDAQLQTWAVDMGWAE